MQKTLGWIMLFAGIVMLVFPTAIPFAVEQRTLTGVSIGTNIDSGMAPLTVKINAILWEWRANENQWIMLPGKMLVYTINGEALAWQYSIEGVRTLQYTFSEPGTFNVQVKFEGDSDYAPSASHVMTVTVTEPYILTVLATKGGTTKLEPGSYKYYVVTTVYCYAYRDSGYDFLYWMLDNEKRTENPVAVVMDRCHTLTVYFEEAKPYFNYTLTASKTEVPDVAEWRYPVIAESETVKFTVTTPPEYPITQPVQLEVKQAGAWQLVREFVVVNGKGTAVEAPGLYGVEDDVLTFRVYDPGTKLESNYVNITLLAPEPKPEEPTPDEPDVEVPPEAQEVPIDETVDEPVQVPKKIMWQLFGLASAGIGLLLIFTGKKRR